MGKRDRQPLILIADDDPTACLIMSKMLANDGYRVVSCDDGAQAVDAFLCEKPAAVVLDGEMPVMDGYQACRQMRQAETDYFTPILIVTGTDDRRAAKAAFDAGATDFLSKPINWSAFPYRLIHILRANDAHNEIAGLLRGLPDRILVLDRDLRALEVRHAGIYAHDNETITVPVLSDTDGLLSLEFIHTIQRRAADVFDSGTVEEFETAVKDGEAYLETRIVPRDHNSVLVIIRDITERKLADHQIQRLAYFDMLTGLPNRGMFSKEARKQIEQSKYALSKLALLYIDLDRFKRINDTLGHSAGDELLSSVAQRLEKVCGRFARIGDGMDKSHKCNVKIARIGGDEFALLLTDIEGPETAMSVADQILKELESPFTHAGHQFVVSPSIGISIMPDDGDCLEDLLKNADTAMYQAKKHGRNNYHFFTDTMNVRSLERLHLENELRDAIEKEALHLVYQPKFDLKTSRVCGCEALLRWDHPSLGQISPVNFIRVAEETGLIIPLGHWVFEETCRQIRLWQGTPLDGVPVAVNVSSQQFMRETFVDDVIRCMTKNDIDGCLLEVEITESTLMSDTSNTMRQLSYLKDAGIALSLDDFGTGYSSFDYLRRFSVDRIKIDRSFVSEIGTKENGGALCAAMIAMTQELGLAVLAEGVETEEQLSFLRSRGCDEIQGYYFCRPKGGDELVHFLKEWDEECDTYDAPDEDTWKMHALNLLGG